MRLTKTPPMVAPLVMHNHHGAESDHGESDSATTRGESNASGPGNRPRSFYQSSALPAMMAIVNRTPDSFYDKGATFTDDAALARVRSCVDAGAAIIDIGGVKAGRGDPVSIAEEIDRVVPFVSAVREEFPSVHISVDTYRAPVGEAAITAGADLINDTWAGADPELVEVAGHYHRGYVCSHTGGMEPRTLPRRVHYDDLVGDVIRSTTQRAEHAVNCGVPKDKVLIDPTHDFGKNTFHSLALVRHARDLVSVGWPVLMALSNKDFVGETVGRPVDQRLAGTLAATALAAAQGVSVFRVHEMAENLDACRMALAVQGVIPPYATTRGVE